MIHIYIKNMTFLKIPDKKCLNFYFTTVFNYLIYNI